MGSNSGHIIPSGDKCIFEEMDEEGEKFIGRCEFLKDCCVDTGIYRCDLFDWILKSSDTGIVYKHNMCYRKTKE